MCCVSVKVETLSLGFLRRLRRVLLLQPPRPHLLLKLLYNVVVLVYLVLISHWRYAFNYNVIYDYRNDYLSRIIDLFNFNLLVIGHFIIIIELIWMNRSERIDQHFLHIQYILCDRLHRNFNYYRVRVYCSIIYGFLFLRIFVLLAITIYNYLASNTSVLLILNFYSELVLIVRCSDFTLHVTLVLAIYQELKEVGSDLILQLEQQHPMSIQKIRTLQQVHHTLWRVHRDIEKSYGQSLLVVMLKYFVDTSVIPYWLYLSSNQPEYGPMKRWFISQEFGKLLEVFIPCWLCTRCTLLQREIRSLFHNISINRHNVQLNNALSSITSQLGQERSCFCLNGFIIINNELLGKFLFCMTSYIFIFIQFCLSFLEKSAAEADLLRSENQTQVVL